jgi:chromosome segregation ATPase
MDNVAGPDAKNALSKWVDEMQGVMKMITSLVEDSDRQRGIVESTQHEQAELREEVSRLRAEVDRERAATASVQRERDHAQRERDQLRTELTTLQSDNERIRTEQVEAGETASKLLGEMKELVNQVAHKFQGPSKSSPFAREPRSPQP